MLIIGICRCGKYQIKKKIHRTWKSFYNIFLQNNYKKMQKRKEEKDFLFFLADILIMKDAVLS